MIYLHIHGRLGNQFFQYAHARYLQYLTGDKLIIDYRDVFASKEPLSEESLKRYNIIEYTHGTGKEIPRYIYYLVRLAWHLKPLNNLKGKYYIERIICPILSLFGICYYDSACHIFNYKPKSGKFNFVKGWYESSKYFEKIDEIIRRELTPKEPLKAIDEEMCNKLKQRNSICVTVRRGDFVEDPNISDRYNVCSIEYFKRGVEYIQSCKSDTIIYVCSDDNEWCRENLAFLGEVIFERDGLSLDEKLCIMTACRNFVISNSSFSWWAQHLCNNKDKIVVAPRKWRFEDPEPIDIKEDYWTYLD